MDEATRELERAGLGGDKSALLKLKAIWLRHNSPGEGLLYVRNDAEANQAMRNGRAMTMTLGWGDLVLVNPGYDEKERRCPIAGPWIGVIESNGTVLVVDRLGSPLEEGVEDKTVYTKMIFRSDVITVLRRRGIEAT